MTRFSQGPDRADGAPLVVGLHAPEHVQDGKEQVQDVKVEPNGCPDVLIIAVAPDQVLGVIQNEACKHQSSKPAEQTN